MSTTPTPTLKPAIRFPLGDVVMTPGVMDLSVAGTLDCLRRHETGDWGDLGPEDKATNDIALQGQGGRLLSAYTVDEEKIWIITEADRSVTTILLPSEY